MIRKTLLLLGCCSLSWVGPALAHGVSLQAEPVEAIAVTGRFDSGEPMNQAQVTIYAPNDPRTPWQTGTADTEGRFLFVPDPSQPGLWEIQMRQAGHGAVMRLPIGENRQTTSSPLPRESPVTGVATGAIASRPQGLIGTVAPPTMLQRWLMGVAIVWGCVGTAFFFSARRRDAHS